MENDQSIETKARAARLVSAYVRGNRLPRQEVPTLIQDIGKALQNIGVSPAGNASGLSPSVPIERSIGRDHIVCLEDGLSFRSLKRHLQAAHGLTPEEYRAKWGLPRSYPMVAPDYARYRSRVAKRSGLGGNTTS